MSVGEKAPVRRQVGTEKANTREPSFKCRKHSDDIKPESDVAPGQAHREPAYWVGGVILPRFHAHQFQAACKLRSKSTGEL